MAVTISKTHTAEAESQSRQDNKTFLYKVYDPDGSYLKTWNDVVNDPTFNWPMNGGLGEMTVRLARKYDAFGEEEDIDLRNEVRVYLRDSDSATSGYENIVNQENTDADITFAVTDTVKIAQSFQPRGNIAVNLVDIYGYADETLHDSIDIDVTVRIEDDAAGSPSGNLVNANATKTLNNLPLTSKWIRFKFPGTFTLTNNTSYWIVISVNNSYFIWLASDGNSYARGIGKHNGGGWSPFDDNNDLCFKVYDKQVTNKRIYSGFISAYEPVIEGPREYVDVTLIGYVATLKDDVYEDSSGNTTVAHATKDPNYIVDDVLTEYGGKITAHDDNTDVGTNVSYTYNTATHLDAIEKAKDLSDEGWYWYVNAYNTLRFKGTSATADHKMIIGRHVARVTLNKRMENIKNVVLFIGGDVGGGVNLYKEYTRSDSVNLYGRRVAIIQDERVIITATAKRIADKLLDEQEEPEIRMELLIEDNGGQDEYRGYNIESISPGDTVSLRNFKSEKTLTLWDMGVWDTDKWDYSISFIAGTVMQIVNIQYHPDHVVLEVSSRPQPVQNKISEMIDQLEEYRNKDNPVVPT